MFKLYFNTNINIQKQNLGTKKKKKSIKKNNKWYCGDKKEKESRMDHPRSNAENMIYTIYNKHKTKASK